MNKLAFLCFFMLLLLDVPLRSADKVRSSKFDILAKLFDLEVQDHLTGDEDSVDFDDSLCSESSDRVSKYVVNVDAFGAVGDGVSDDTKAFVDAWNKACSKSNSVLMVPATKSYLVHATRFKGPCVGKLTVQIDGTIVAPSDPKKWDPKNPRVWLMFSNISTTKFQGSGLIDGSGAKWWAASCKRNKSNTCKGAPTALTIDSSSDIKVKGLTIQNGQQMNFVISNCDTVSVTGVEVSAPGDSPNTDGIHIAASTNIVIKNCIIGTGDDCVSIVNASSNIKMKNMYCGPGHGISIGSLGKDNSIAIVENVSLDTAYLQNASNGLRIKTWQGGSGYVKTISFQNVRMDRVSNPIIIDQFYCDSPKACHNQTSAVEISGIMYTDISGTSNSKHAMSFSCSDTVPCTYIELSNINLRSANGTKVDTFCNSASGEEDGNVQPPANCLSPSSNYTMISQKTEVGDTQISKEHIIHTEL